jgi:hypothetical protein
MMIIIKIIIVLSHSSPAHSSAILFPHAMNNNVPTLYILSQNRHYHYKKNFIVKT